MMTTRILLTVHGNSTLDRVIAAWHAARPAARIGASVAVIGGVVISWNVVSVPANRIALSLVGALFALAALVDLHEHRLPNRLLAAALFITVAGIVVAADEGSAVGALVGAVMAGGPMLAVHLTRGVGLGDVKMATVLGASLGVLVPAAAPVAIAITAIVAAVCGVVTRRSRLALGPALWLGWASALVSSSAIAGWW